MSKRVRVERAEKVGEKLREMGIEYSIAELKLICIGCDCCSVIEGGICRHRDSCLKYLSDYVEIKCDISSSRLHKIIEEVKKEEKGIK